MSIQAVGWVLKHEDRTAGVTRLVLLTLANYADEAGVAYPSVKRIAAECNCSTRSVQYAINELVDLGLVLRQLQAATDARIPRAQRPNVYRITPPADSAPLGGFTGRKPRPKGAQSTTSPGEAGFTQKVIEPSTSVSGRAPFTAPMPDEVKAQRSRPRKAKTG